MSDLIFAIPLALMALFAVTLIFLSILDHLKVGYRIKRLIISYKIKKYEKQYIRDIHSDFPYWELGDPLIYNDTNAGVITALHERFVYVLDDNSQKEIKLFGKQIDENPRARKFLDKKKCDRYQKTVHFPIQKELVAAWDEMHYLDE